MNEQFETQNPVENTVTPANQMETSTPEAPKKKGNKIAIIAGVVAAVVVAGGVVVFAAVKTGAFLSPSKKVLLAGAKTVSDMGSLGENGSFHERGRYFHGGTLLEREEADKRKSQYFRCAFNRFSG